MDNPTRIFPGVVFLILLVWQIQPVQAFPADPGSYRTSAAAIPALQTTTLQVEILSAPIATIAVSQPETGPRLFVVQARVTNTGAQAATNLTVTLQGYADQAGWVLASGEDPERFVQTLAAGATYDAFWLASYPTTDGVSNPYTVTADADNANPVSDTDTVTTDTANRAGNSSLDQTDIDVQVGFEFTIVANFLLGNNLSAAILTPAGNLNFDAGAYRLVSSNARFYTDSNPNLLTVSNRLYVIDPALSNLPSNVEVSVEVTYTFLALKLSNTNICPFSTAQSGSTFKFDNDFCTGDSTVNVDGELTITMSKQSSRSQIEQGDVMTYTIFYQNTFTQTVEGVWIWDEPPTGVTIRENSIIPAKDATESTADRIVWNLGSVPAGGQGTLQFAVDVDGEGATLANGTSLVNPAFLSINPDRFTAQSILTDTATTTVNAPNITLTKTDGKPTANPGEFDRP